MSNPYSLFGLKTASVDPQYSIMPVDPPVSFGQSPPPDAPDLRPMYGIGGAAAGAAGGAALGAGLGDLVAGQSYRTIFNVPIPGTQRIENNEGRLVGGAIGALLGGAAGGTAGANAAERERYQSDMNARRMQERAEIMRRMRTAAQ